MIDEKDEIEYLRRLIAQIRRDKVSPYWVERWSDEPGMADEFETYLLSLIDAGGIVREVWMRGDIVRDLRGNLFELYVDPRSTQPWRGLTSNTDIAHGDFDRSELADPLVLLIRGGRPFVAPPEPAADQSGAEGHSLLLAETVTSKSQTKAVTFVVGAGGHRIHARIKANAVGDGEYLELTAGEGEQLRVYARNLFPSGRVAIYAGTESPS